MKALIAKALNALRYPSTYKGLFTILGLIGVNVAPDHADTIANAAIGVVGAISLFLSDADVAEKKKK